MADVSGERGQLMLVTAVSIAALLVLVAVLLSSVVYTENVASRDGRTDEARAARLHQVAAVDAVSGLLGRANRNGTSYEGFRENVSAWDERNARYAATAGASARVSVNATTNATRIRQTNATRNLTNATGSDSWGLATGASTVDDWTLTVERVSLVAPAATTNASDLQNASAFTVAVTDASVTWRAFVYREAGYVVVRVDDGTGLAPACRALPDADGTVTVDLSARTVGGNDCPALGFDDDVSAPFAVEHRSAANARGTYSLVVDRPVSDVDDGDYAADGSPFVEPHVDDVRIDVTYRAPGFVYRAQNLTVTEGMSP